MPRPVCDWNVIGPMLLEILKEAVRWYQGNATIGAPDWFLKAYELLNQLEQLPKPY